MWEWIDNIGDDPLDERQRQVLRASVGVNSAGYDPWGFHLPTAERTLRLVRVLYRDYFRVGVHHADRVPPGRLMVVANHGGQVPLDGMMIAAAMMMEVEPPRLVRGMVERWVPAQPWVSTLFTRCGQVVGDPANAEELLRRNQSILVFPEGAKGSGKTWWNRYRLQTFGTGFVRLAQETQTPILPISVLGSDDTYPSLHSSRLLSRLVGAPYFPITPTWPWLGPIGMVPLPVKIDLVIGAPISFTGEPDEPEATVLAKVTQVRSAIQAGLDEGLAQRPDLAALGRVAAWGRR
jgi:1-acyl-sn-glycerol-3-phosphate acyltransferase